MAPPPAGPHPEPKETCHLLWKPDFRKWPHLQLDPILSPRKLVIFYGTTILENRAPPPFFQLDPHPEPDELRYVEPQYDVMQLPAANSRQPTSIKEAQSKHVTEQVSELRSSSVCLPCRLEGVTGVVLYKVI